MSALIWAACSQKLWRNGYRHLVFRRGLTTFCGSTASHADIWRKNAKREQCPDCLARARRTLQASEIPS